MPWLAWLACTDAPEEPVESELPAAETPEGSLTEIERAVRISMALRGVRPSFEDLERLIEDPDVLPDLVDAWLETPEFGETVRDLWDEALQLRADSMPLDATGSLEGYTLMEVGPVLQEAPLRTIERMVREDRPFTELVTGDWAEANAVVASAWTGLGPYDAAGPEWQPLPWVDGRPAAGILSDSSVWVRWRSAGANAQRGRANLVARALLCDDFLARDATIDVSDIGDPSAGATALDSPACAGCHLQLDPLASFFPFVEYAAVQFLVFPVDMYDETWLERRGWELTTGVQPDYYGLGGVSLQDMVERIASDPRFSRCVASRHWAFLHQRAPGEIDPEDLARYEAVLLERGSMKDLFRVIALEEDFASLAGGARRVRAEALPRLIEDLTGFRWVVDGQRLCCPTTAAPLGEVHLGEDALRGWVALWGGIDGPYIAQPTHESTTTSVLVLEAYAALAATHVVDADLSEPDRSARRLLRWVEADTQDPELVRRQLSRLHLRVLGEAIGPDDPALEPSVALFTSALEQGGSPRRAWTIVLTAMLSDERLEYY